MRLISEFISVVFAALAGFVAMIMAACGAVLYFLLALIAVLMLLVALACGIGFAFDHSSHDLMTGLGFLLWSALAFTAATIMAYYADKLKINTAARRDLRRLGPAGVKLTARDEAFNS